MDHTRNSHRRGCPRGGLRAPPTEGHCQRQMMESDGRCMRQMGRGERRKETGRLSPREQREEGGVRKESREMSQVPSGRNGQPVGAEPWTGVETGRWLAVGGEQWLPSQPQML